MTKEQFRPDDHPNEHFDGVWLNGTLVETELEGVNVTDNAWTTDQTPAGANLAAVAQDYPDIAVGAGGLVLERN